ncbi:hypothetical protein P775_27185 [Puniceibacterium antarcticum]|uniref:Uncharacterized protein n=1 Tax=Puniceibacterium antarcticum TaxID=1206336 RepID=A0A2G8QWJ8_9RHOB|nr:hypothetical protein P775_27185 [Puniceibacterium antarcticum]
MTDHSWSEISFQRCIESYESDAATEMHLHIKALLRMQFRLIPGA